MLQKNTIFLIIVILVTIAAILGVGAYYYLSQKSIQPPAQETEEKKQERLLKEKYPDVINGTIVFSEKKVTVKTTDGKEYWLWPPQLPSVYEKNGIKDGQTVEIRGKIMDKERIYVRLLK